SVGGSTWQALASCSDDRTALWVPSLIAEGETRGPGLDMLPERLSAPTVSCKNGAHAFQLWTLSHLTMLRPTAMLSTSFNNSFPSFSKLGFEASMNRRDLLKSLSMLAAFGRPPSVLTADSLSGKVRLRTAICAYSFREALKKKSMTYDDLVRLA